MNQYNNIYGSQAIPLSQIYNSNQYENIIGQNIGSALKSQQDDQLKSAIFSILGDSLKNTQFFDRDGKPGALSNIWGNITTGGSAESAAKDGAASESSKLMGSGTGAEEGGFLSSLGGGFKLSGIGASGNYILPAAGAYGMYDVLTNKKSTKSSIGQGAASGAAIGSYFGPKGAIIGAIIGGTVGGVNKVIRGPSKTDHEQARFKKLYDDKTISGTYDHDVIDQLNSRVYDEFGHDARGFVTLPDGRKIRVNNVFNKSRKESDLQGWDLVDRAAAYEHYGKSFQDLPYEIRAQVLQGAIDRNLVREHHGTIDISRDEALDAAVAKAQEDYKIQKAKEEAAKRNRKPKDDEL